MKPAVPGSVPMAVSRPAPDARGPRTQPVPAARGQHQRARDEPETTPPLVTRRPGRGDLLANPLYQPQRRKDR